MSSSSSATTNPTIAEWEQLVEHLKRRGEIKTKLRDQIKAACAHLEAADAQMELADTCLEVAGDTACDLERLLGLPVLDSNSSGGLFYKRIGKLYKIGRKCEALFLSLEGLEKFFNDQAVQCSERLHQAEQSLAAAREQQPVATITTPQQILEACEARLQSLLASPDRELEATKARISDAENLVEWARSNIPVPKQTP